MSRTDGGCAVRLAWFESERRNCRPDLAAGDDVAAKRDAGIEWRVEGVLGEAIDRRVRFVREEDRQERGDRAGYGGVD